MLSRRKSGTYDNAMHFNTLQMDHLVNIHHFIYFFEIKMNGTPIATHGKEKKTSSRPRTSVGKTPSQAR